MFSTVKILRLIFEHEKQLALLESIHWKALISQGFFGSTRQAAKGL